MSGYLAYSKHVCARAVLFVQAVENSGTAVGIRCKDGVVFGVEKLITAKLYESTSTKRIFNIDRHIGMAVAGILQ